jgi:hypothetical protein
MTIEEIGRRLKPALLCRKRSFDEGNESVGEALRGREKIIVMLNLFQHLTR